MAASLANYLRAMAGKYVQMERGGPEKSQGWVLGVYDDYITLGTSEGAKVHYQLHHIKAISAYLHQNQGNGSAQQMPTFEPDGNHATFRELLASYKGQLVRINQGGPESAVGLVHEVTDDYVVLASGQSGGDGNQQGIKLQELVCYPIFHIRSVSTQLEKKKDEKKDKDGEGGKEEAHSKEAREKAAHK